MLAFRTGAVAILAVLVASLPACGGDAGAAGERVTLTGAGSTFVFPIFSRWFNAFAQEHPVRVNYGSIGSGGGIQQFTEGTVDFGASDAPMNDDELARVPGTLHLPVVMGAVVVTYNLPQMGRPLRLDGATAAGLFLGEIRRWDDPRIAALNPGVTLPAADVIVVHRSDGSGTTYVFSDYLASVSPQWLDRVGVGKSLRWPTGVGARGNEGVTGQVRQTPGAIGYVEQVYARQQGLPMAAVQNASGEFVEPSIEATRAAAARLDAMVRAQPDLRFSIVNAAAPGAYPVTGWVYVLARPHMENCGRARALRDVFTWAVTEGDSHAEELNYAPVPESVSEIVRQRLGSITCGEARHPVSAGQG
jgi:phosphate transport system substrate-binding protein